MEGETMSAESTRRLPQNVSGKFFTTEECDGCAYCASIAPDNFDFEKSSNRYFVSRQPKTAEEEEYMREAVEDCPVDAIATDDPDLVRALK
jgi:ferredoxin